jgi:hypothetical protein
MLSKTRPSTHRPTAISSFEFRPLNSSSVAIANNSAQLAAITIDSKQGARWRLTGALIRIGNTHETDGDFNQAIRTYERLLKEETAALGPTYKVRHLSGPKISALHNRASNYTKALDWSTRTLSSF